MKCECPNPDPHGDSQSPTWSTCYRCNRPCGDGPDPAHVKAREDRMRELREGPTGSAAGSK